MSRLSDQELWGYIREDLPYFDLTTHLLELPPVASELSIVTRHEVVVACSEEAARIGELLDCEVVGRIPSGRRAEAGDTLLRLRGEHEGLHQAWRLCQVLLEYACGLATHADAMLRNARAVNPRCEIMVTRKSHPFAKRFTIRALLCGGVLPHRLGLSESVLIFGNHRALYATPEAFESALPQIKSRCVEKKLVVESESLEDAKRMLELGADVIQMDKSTPELIQAIVDHKNAHHPGAAILAAGGINKANVAEFAATGVDGVVTSSLYKAPMADLTSRWELL